MHQRERARVSNLKRRSIREARRTHEAEKDFHMRDSFSASLDPRNDRVEVRQNPVDDPNRPFEFIRV